MCAPRPWSAQHPADGRAHRHHRIARRAILTQRTRSAGLTILAAVERAKEARCAPRKLADGLTWRRRSSDLKKILALQNSGEVSRIYTRAMVEDMVSDFNTLKVEHEL